MSTEYHKIQTIFKRDLKTKKIIEGDYSLPEFDYLKNNDWVFTEKVDGTNIRVIWDGNDVVFAGKTEDASLPTFLLYKLQELFEGTANKEKLRAAFPDIAAFISSDPDAPVVTLYGEGYGAKIQKGGDNYIRNGVDFVLFDVKIGNWWLRREDVEDVARKLGIRSVPIIGTGTLQTAIETVRKGFKSQWGDFTAEGIVARPATELFTRSGERIITKIKHRDFK